MSGLSVRYITTAGPDEVRRYDPNRLTGPKAPHLTRVVPISGLTALPSTSSHTRKPCVPVRLCRDGIIRSIELFSAHESPNYPSGFVGKCYSDNFCWSSLQKCVDPGALGSWFCPTIANDGGGAGDQ